MKCPNCNAELNIYHIDDRTSINIINYICPKCSKDFERHTIIDTGGKVKDDKLYELNDIRQIKREWL